MKKQMTLLCAIALLSFTNAYAAEPGYLMSITNNTEVSTNAYEFDVFVKSTGSSFEITSYQCAFSLNSLIINCGNPVFSYIQGSSDFTNIPPSVGIKLDSLDNIYEIIFASMPGSQMISMVEKKVGRFRLENSVPFANIDPNFNWNFDGVLCTIITGQNFTEITNPDFHLYDFQQISELEVINAYASATSDMNTTPGKTIDGIGYYDGDPYSRWAATPMPHWLMVDLGTEQSVSQTRISFFNFQENRIYQYSIFVSIDSLNWTEVVSNNNSAPIEWTVNNFSLVTTRYIKLLCLSSTNNPSNWANVWEFEVWGTEQTTPVELSAFTVEVFDNKNIKLNWITETETNNRGFEIQKSYGDDFIPIGFVEGRGTTTERSEYSFLVENELPGTYTYRLKQIDFNGGYSYSPSVEIELTSSQDYVLYQNYPNPFNPTTNIRFSLPENKKVKLTVFNILGEVVSELVNEEMPTGLHEVTFDARNLASGIYVSRLDVENQFSEVRKMTLIK